ncbi:MAG: alpha/beta hydrolase, partial [Acidimicrobiia bacterium]
METTVLEVRAADGRRIEVMHTDLARDAVVVSHGGTPNGLAEWPWLDELAAAAGLGLVAFNRPGYGASDRRAEPAVARNADDTACVLDHLGVDAFVSLGSSGGGPYALADGARLRGRCRGVVVVGGLGPADADGLDFTDGMGEANWAVFGAACTGRQAVTPIAEMYATMMSAVTATSLTEFADSLF